MAHGNSSQASWAPGQVWPQAGQITGLESRANRSLTLQNTGDRPIQVGSHFHFFEVNKALDFPRAEAWGTRLAIPAGTAMRFEPGMQYKVELIELGGERVVHGLNNLCDGKLDTKGALEKALEKARAAGYKGA